MSRTNAIGTWLLNEEIAIPSETEAGTYKIVTAWYGYTSQSLTLLHEENPFLGGPSSWFNINLDDNDDSYSTASFYASYSTTSGSIDLIDFGSGIATNTISSVAKRTFTIQSGEDVENANLIVWLEANATYQEEPTATITYNGSKTGLFSGQIATLACADKVAKTDIAVNTAAIEKYDGEITYLYQIKWYLDNELKCTQYVEPSAAFEAYESASYEINDSVVTLTFTEYEQMTSVSYEYDYGVTLLNKYETRCNIMSHSIRKGLIFYARTA